MGVKGMWTKVVDESQHEQQQQHHHLNDMIYEELSLLPPHPPRRLHIDAMAFLYHFFDREDQQQRINHERWHYLGTEVNGDYSRLEDVLTTELQQLQQYLHFEMIFYFDNSSQSYFKADTRKERRKQLEDSYLHFFELTLGDSSSNSTAESLPMPPLAVNTLLSVLVRERIEIVQCVAEADQDIALGCKRDLDQGVMAFCYSGDSDFLLMKDCKLIRLGTLDEFTTTTRSSSQPHTPLTTTTTTTSISIPVWSREKVAALFDISPHQLVEWGILVGNDFTRHFTANQLNDHFATSCQSRYADDVLDFIKENPPDYQCHSDHYVVETTLAFCRAFYELEDLTPFYREEFKTISTLDDDEEEEELEDGFVVHDDEVDRIEEWLGQQDLSHIIAGEVNLQLPGLTCSFLESYLLQEGLTEGKLSKDRFIEPVHIQCLREMSGSIARSNENNNGKKKKRQGVPLESLHFTLRWNNIRVGAFYQLVAKEIYHILKETILSSSSNCWIPPLDPSLIYDGFSFHVRLSRRESSSTAVTAAVKTTTPSKEQPVTTTTATTAIDKDKKIKDGPSSSLSSLPLSSSASKKKGNKKLFVQEEENANPILPVDAHRETILKKIETDRVTIIHGETGCGKSSRIPVFIYEEALKKHEPCKILISQPHRLAVVNLKNRLQKELGSKVGMRMGHGVREETKDTRIYFVTSGYLVQLFAHYMAAAKKITHLIVDEVHERSIDSDLLCWLVKELLVRCPHLRVILMSATLHVDLYGQYFSAMNVGDLRCISVGARRFPMEVFYLDSIVASKSKGGFQDLPKTVLSKCNAMVKACRNAGPNLPVDRTFTKDQYEMVRILVRTQCEKGTGVLIFVAGMDDIIELQAKFEDLVGYNVIAIHSDLPFEEQEAALVPAGPDEVKVVVATNAAESSLTLPDVDVVICCGFHKEVRCSTKNIVRSALTKTWISKSSATQRAGRTGRVRPGRVFRLYTEAIFDSFEDFNTAEIQRTPLHEVILSLHGIFENESTFDGVTPLLESLIEPPAVEAVINSQQYLYSEEMISAPNDGGRLTSLGAFAGRMPLDLSGSKLVIYGILLGIGTEAIVIATALAQPKTVFRIAHPIIHSDPDEYNEIVRKTFFGALHYDQGLYSDAIRMLNIYLDWKNKSSHRDHLNMCQRYGLVMARVKHFASSVRNLVERVKETHQILAPNCHLNLDMLESSSRPLSSSVVNRLRLALLWTLHGNVMISNPKKVTVSEWPSMQIADPSLNADALAKLFPNPIRYEERLLGRWTFKVNDGRMLYDDKQSMENAVLRVLCVGLKLTEKCMATLPISPPQTNANTNTTLTTNTAAVEKGKMKTKKMMKKEEEEDMWDVLIAYPVEDVDNPMTLDTFGLLLSTTIEVTLRRTCNREVIFLQDGEGNGRHVNLFHLHQLTVNEVQIVDNLIQSHPSVIMRMKNSHDCRVTMVNIEPKKTLLQSIIHPSVVSGDGSVGGQNSLQLLKAENVVQTITFLEDEEDEDDEDNDKVTTRITTGGFNDLPVGRKLFNMYCEGYKKKKMFVREEASAQQDQNSSTNNNNKIIVGSVEWQKLKEKEQKQQQLLQATEEEEKRQRVPVTEVNAKMFSGQWLVIEDGLHGFSQEDNDISYNLIDYSILPRHAAKIGGHSILSSSHFLPSNKKKENTKRKRRSSSSNSNGDSKVVTAEVTGVAYSALTLERKNPDGVTSSISVICDGVTLFPPGKIWISRALLCINRILFPDFRRVVEQSNEESELLTTTTTTRAAGNGNGDEDEDLQSVSKLELCGQICDYLVDVKINEIAPSTELMSLVDALFLDFL